MSSPPQPETVEILLPSTIGYEKVARNAVEAIAQEMGFSPDRVEDLKTAVAEACLNAIEHGNQENKSAMVTVLLTTADEKLEISITDEGLTPMPDHIPMAERGNIQSRGWGMFFIANLVDQVEITRLPAGGNSIRMVIRLEPPVEADADHDEGEMMPKTGLPASLTVEPAIDAKPADPKTDNISPSTDSKGDSHDSKGGLHRG